MCSQDPEQRVSGGWQGSKGLMPSMHCVPCKTTQQLKLRNRQANSWSTSRPIPRNDHILLHQVFLRLKVLIEDKHLPCLFFSDLCLFLCTAGIIHYLYLFLVGLCENHFSESHHYLSKNLSCHFFPWTTKHHLLTTIHGRVLVLHQGMLHQCL